LAVLRQPSDYLHNHSRTLNDYAAQEQGRYQKPDPHFAFCPPGG
jgi:hypothetical protein